MRDLMRIMGLHTIVTQSFGGAFTVGYALQRDSNLSSTTMF